METTTTTRNIETPYQNGIFVNVDVTLDNGAMRNVSVFIGTIDYPKRDEVAGYPRPQGYLENYTRIFWAERFVVTDIDHNTRQTFEDTESAVRFYYSLDSDHKTLKQVRVLVDGSEDLNAVAYRWN